MENTQKESRYCILLSLNFLIAEKRSTVDNRHLIINVAVLIQPIYFENV